MFSFSVNSVQMVLFLGSFGQILFAGGFQMRFSGLMTKSRRILMCQNQKMMKF